MVTKLIRKCFNISAEDAEFLDRLGKKLGSSTGYALRTLIRKAREEEAKKCQSQSSI